MNTKSESSPVVETPAAATPLFKTEEKRSVQPYFRLTPTNAKRIADAAVKFKISQGEVMDKLITNAHASGLL